LILCATTAASQTSSTATGVSREFNPALSVNGLFLGQTSSDEPTAEANGIGLQEAELQFSSVVDPFWEADLILALHPAHAESGDVEGAHDHAGIELDLEVATLSSRNMPAGLGLVLGKFFLPFGAHVPLHTHQFPFVRAPLAIQAFLGDHALSETGVEVAASIPLPWYSELRVYAVNGDAALFDAGNRDLACGGRWMNMWETGLESTLELGASLLAGPAHPHHEDGEEHPAGDLRVYGADLAYKWTSSTRSQGPALSFRNEIILPDPEYGEHKPWGYYSLLQYRFHRNLWLGVGYGEALKAHLDLHHHEGDAGEEEHEAGDWRELKANLTLAPSEFSALKLEVSHIEQRDGDFEDLRLMLQWNFTIGSHPAHKY